MAIVQRFASDRAALRGLAVVGVASFGAQLLLAPWRIAASWDEAIYLSQVMPGPALPFAASRARGIVALVAPLAAAGVPQSVLRVVLAAAAAAAIALAFVPWVRLLGTGAAWAAAVFASSWSVLFYGSEVMPNLWVALFGVAAVGVAVHAVDGPGRWTLLAAAALAAVVAAIRPLDAIVILAPVMVLAVARRVWPAAAAVLLGVAGGIAPWAIEMTVRWGGVAEALRAAGHMGGVGAGDPVSRALDHLALADGPLIGATGGTSVIAVLWLMSAVVLTIAGVRSAPGETARRSLVVAVASAILVVGLYVTSVSGTAPRFLLPAFAFISLPMGVALGTMAPRRALRPVVAAFVLLWAGSHVVVALDVGETITAERAGPQAVGRDLRELLGTTDCVVLGASWPQVAYAAGCQGIRDAVDAPTAAREVVQAGLRPIVIVQHGAVPPALPLRPLFSASGLDVYEVVPGVAGA